MDGVTDSVARELLRDEIDARLARFYGLTWDEFEYILEAFLLDTPDRDTWRARRAQILAVYETVG